jgi:hypothetical protein
MYAKLHFGMRAAIGGSCREQFRGQLRPSSHGGFMKKTALLVWLSAFTLLADVTGKWSGTGSKGDESHPLFFVLKQDGKTLTGSGGPSEDEQHPMEPGTVEGDRLKFKVIAGKGVLSFDLKASGDEINGQAEFKKDDGEAETFNVALKKAK